jgi:hypothetical protein
MDSNRRKDLKTPDDAVSDDEQLHSKLGVLYADVSAEGIIGGIYKGLAGCTTLSKYFGISLRVTTRVKLEGCVSRRHKASPK